MIRLLVLKVNKILLSGELVQGDIAWQFFIVLVIFFAHSSALLVLIIKNGCFLECGLLSIVTIVRHIDD